MSAQVRPAGEPDFKGIAGEYWNISIDGRVIEDPAQKANLANVLLHCPLAHPAWHYWGASLIHLRPIPGASRDTHLRFPAATHEIMVFALDPSEPLPSLDGRDTFKFLTPIDQSVQFELSDDAAALHVFETLVQACCNGALSPDQDFRRVWKEQARLLSDRVMGRLH